MLIVILFTSLSAYIVRNPYFDIVLDEPHDIGFTYFDEFDSSQDGYFLDIGAGAGWNSLYAASKGWNVISIESDNYEHLKESIRINHFEDRIRLYTHIFDFDITFTLIKVNHSNIPIPQNNVSTLYDFYISNESGQKGVMYLPDGNHLVNLVPGFNYTYIKISNTLLDPTYLEYQKFSLNGEDGITEALLTLLDISRGYYVELYIGRCNTCILRNHWEGISFDPGVYDLNINLRREIINPNNINEIFEDYDIPNDFDFLSISTYYNEFYLWRALMKRPKIVLINYNSALQGDKVVIHDPHAYWDGTEYFGASILSMYNLGRSKGYSLVYSESEGETLFFVRDDLVGKINFVNINNVNKLMRNKCYRKDPKKRNYVSWTE